MNQNIPTYSYQPPNITRPINLVPMQRPRPNAVVVPQNPPITVYIGKIPPALDDDVLLAICRCCGHVVNWRRVVDPITGNHKQFGYCDFGNAESAQRGLSLIPKCFVNGINMCVQVDKKNEELIQSYSNNNQGIDNKSKNVKDERAYQQMNVLIREWESKTKSEQILIKQQIEKKNEKKSINSKEKSRSNSTSIHEHKSSHSRRSYDRKEYEEKEKEKEKQRRKYESKLRNWEKREYEKEKSLEHTERSRN
ncbi:splicing factor pwi domain-containing protein / RNA recognition motif (rrm)-containing protein [Anaeramoeba ignava]|uniref:Splicing factor pwi domain-containing protein / RNA recognition motif (Rrm)-containing protein n=1 Tax=Anaeramoeba ignava TaxID=1746090 RepID=A0A9Q0LXH7_ANAIG|nr:splicing factor pwi domain-containing protein / RNA recognition motif (rrm)-containing protein [Anaeramoeba ignava]